MEISTRAAFHPAMGLREPRCSAPRPAEERPRRRGRFRPLFPLV